MKTTLYLSGGSHRAALGAIGTIVYLMDSSGTFQWSQVDEIVGVSGGSQPIAALAASGAKSDQEVSDTMQRLYAAIDEDRLTLATPIRLFLVGCIAIAATLPITLWITLTLLFVPAVVAFPIGLITIAVAYRSISMLLSRLQKHYVRTILRSAAGKNGDADRAMKDLPQTHIHYAIVSAGVDTGSMYQAWIGPTPSPALANPGMATGAPAATKELINAISPVDASVASSSLPPTSRLKSPSTLSNGTPAALREVLTDGGAGGNFGLQIASDITTSIVTGGSTSTNRQVLALDAGRRIKTSPPFARTLSTVARLMRWIQLTNDATYLNDLEDLQHLTSTATAGAIDVAMTPAPGATSKQPGSVEAKQLQAIQANARLDLFSLDADTIPLAVACGVVGALLTDAAAAAKLQSAGASTTVSLVDTKQALDLASNRLGTSVDLYTAWDNAS